MMHSIRGVGLKPPFKQYLCKWVSIVALDAALANFPHQADRRVILKVDAEGLEPQVMAGAAKLLDSGRVALIIWERGHSFNDGPERIAMIEMVQGLTQRGFRHFRPRAEHIDGPLLPFEADSDYTGNVFSFSPGLGV
jgi:hypothetical protein